MRTKEKVLKNERTAKAYQAAQIEADKKMKSIVDEEVKAKKEQHRINDVTSEQELSEERLAKAAKEKFDREQLDSRYLKADAELQKRNLKEQVKLQKIKREGKASSSG